MSGLVAKGPFSSLSAVEKHVALQARQSCLIQERLHGKVGLTELAEGRGALAEGRGAPVLPSHQKGVQAVLGLREMLLSRGGSLCERMVEGIKRRVRGWL